jgi:2-keto-4-pentenoate hydratase
LLVLVLSHAGTYSVLGGLWRQLVRVDLLHLMQVSCATTIDSVFAATAAAPAVLNHPLIASV